MGRPLTFDRTAALNAATDLFWRQGFKAASLSDLTEAMGISRSSFYQSFGNKQELLGVVLDEYAQRQAARCAAFLERRSLRARLRKIFESIAHDNNGGRGCLLGNCAAELGPHDPDVAARVRRGIGIKAQVFTSAVIAAQGRGEVDPQLSAVDIGNYLASAITGLRVLAKTGMPAAALVKIGDIVISNISAQPARAQRAAANRRRQQRKSKAGSGRNATRSSGRAR